MSAGRWISLKTDIFSAICVGATAIFSVASVSLNYTSSPAIIGVALTAIL